MRAEQDQIVADEGVRVEGSWLKTARLVDEWFVDLEDPDEKIRALRRANMKADVFTFLQRLPDTTPRYGHFMHPSPQAVLPISTYEAWYRTQINNKTRNLITKARKKGVVVRSASFDDDFLGGMVSIFDEWPVRQGRLFWHYRKTLDTLRREFSRYLYREEIAGAYVNDQLVGFIFLAHAGRFMLLTQFISMMRHREKAVNNALIAKAVEICAERGVSHLMYGVWPRGSLKDFKRHNGFDRVDVPRYYVPLTTKGRLALQSGLHPAPFENMPDEAFLFLRNLRTKFYSWRYGDPPTSPPGQDLLNANPR